MNEFVLFTNVVKHLNWIHQNVDLNPVATTSLVTVKTTTPAQIMKETRYPTQILSSYRKLNFYVNRK